MWTALSFGTFADNTLRQALLIGIPAGIIQIPFLSNADNAVPIIGLFLPIAIMVFSSISGQFADKFETSMMFRRTKFIELLLMAVAAVAFASGIGWLAVVMLFAMGAQSAFFSPVRIGAMPKYLQTNELVRGNGLCNAGLYTFILLGTMTGSALILQENGGLMTGGALIAASLIGWLAALRAPFAEANEPKIRLDFNWFEQTRALFNFVLSSRGVAPPLLGIGVFYYLSTFVIVAIPFYGRDALHATPIVWAALNGLFAIGAGLGAIAAAALPKGQASLGVSALTIACAGIVSFLVYFITPVAAGDVASPIGISAFFSGASGISLSLVLVLTSAFAGMYLAPLQAAMQRRAPKPVRARIMAASAFANAAFAIPGSLSVFAITAAGLDPRLVFIAVGGAMLIIAGIMYYRKTTLAEGLYDEMLEGSLTPAS